MSSKFIHIEIVHPDPDAAAAFIRETIGGVDVEPRMAAHLESVMPGLRAVHVLVGNCVLQFVRPSPAMASWQEQLDTSGPGVHNVTFEVSDFEAVTAALRERGAETLLAVDDVDLRPGGPGVRRRAARPHHRCSRAIRPALRAVLRQGRLGARRDAMSKTYKVIQWATGEVGSLCLRETIRRPELELVGLRVYNPDKDGKDAGDIVGVEPTGVIATADRDAIIASDADCVIHTPLAANMQELDDDVVALLESGKNVISTAAYFAPEFRGQDVADRLQAACEKGGTTLLGTGVEPGFMFERVMPTLTGMCTDIDHIRLVEVIDAARHPAAMMIKEALGIGKPLDEVTTDSPFGQYFVRVLLRDGHRRRRARSA